MRWCCWAAREGMPKLSPSGQHAVAHIVQHARYQGPDGIVALREVSKQGNAEKLTKEPVGEAAEQFYKRCTIATTSPGCNASPCMSNSVVTMRSTLIHSISCSPALTTWADVSSSRSQLPITRSMRLILGVPHSGFGLNRSCRLLLRACLLRCGFEKQPLGLNGMSFILKPWKPTKSSFIEASW